MTQNISHDHAAFVTKLMAITADELKASAGDSNALTKAITTFYNAATAANLVLEEIENILGVNEGCIMDLAQLSEDDEEVAIEAFEDLSHT